MTLIMTTTTLIMNEGHEKTSADNIQRKWLNLFDS